MTSYETESPPLFNRTSSGKSPALDFQENDGKPYGRLDARASLPSDWPAGVPNPSAIGQLERRSPSAWLGPSSLKLFEKVESGYKLWWEGEESAWIIYTSGADATHTCWTHLPSLYEFSEPYSCGCRLFIGCQGCLDGGLKNESYSLDAVSGSNRGEVSKFLTALSNTFCMLCIHGPLKISFFHLCYMKINSSALNACFHYWFRSFCIIFIQWCQCIRFSLQCTSV